MDRLKVTLAASALLFLAGCGGGSDEKEESAGSPTTRVTTTVTARRTPTPTRSVTPTPVATLTAPPEQAPTEAPAETQPPPAQQDTPAPAANNPPGFPAANVIGEETIFEYDDNGNLTGAVTTLTVTAASDPDGDPISYYWTASTGSISGNGLAAVWTRAIEFGGAAPGTVTVTADDGRSGTAQFIIEYL